MNGKQEEKLQQLLRLKRCETPGKPYFDHFLAEFHRYQRAELLEAPSKWQEFKNFLSDCFVVRPVRTLAYSSSFAAVAVLCVLGVSSVLSPSGGGFSMAGNESARSLSSKSVAAATEHALQKIEVQPVSLSAFDRDFNAPRFVTGERTLAYENTVAF